MYKNTHTHTHTHTHTVGTSRTFHSKRGWYIKWPLSFTGLTTTKTAAMQFPSRPVQVHAAAMQCYTICCHWQQRSTAHKQM